MHMKQMTQKTKQSQKENEEIFLPMYF